MRTRGFTLIELLVAISLMALMAVLGWRSLDGVSQTSLRLQQRSDDLLTLQATLSQWGSDLDAMTAQGNLPGLDWDGRTLRLLRRSATQPQDGLVVVAWARRSNGAQGDWLRWQSPPLVTREALDEAWQKAALWAQTPSDDDRLREVRTVAIDQWQIFYYRGNAWSNPLSSADSPAGPTPPGVSGAPGKPVPALPDGVRLVLTLTGNASVGGTLTRDWVSPWIVGGK
ncbi:MAG: general secretion pathway protein J [Comamonadaceae bacterium CG1_02_60_18]|nr:MAG: general secretion pathway protein J [Comamonadaceae bacterium CG1_02_60_18]PIQ52909.1 MAG: general secretion pathway protein J [Comamonadaceae bacterium CG12_big_fil_rev_8_21_14_0_65_59_15]